MINIPKGTKDLLPADSYRWHYLESAIRRVTQLYQLQEIRTPTFEHTELFLRGVGDTTDIVNKEMYTFEDKSGRSITLKPEGTAGVARSFIENNLAESGLPMRCYYQTSVFRYERPQAGRLREHHQFGVEVYGSAQPQADAEVIAMAKTMFDTLGLQPTLYINSIGCNRCRPRYHAALRAYLQGNAQGLCATCRERLSTNPLRILDCKNEQCAAIVKGAPSILDYLCDDCTAHFAGVQHNLRLLQIPFCVNASVVRGLDYYTRTVFEFVSENIGAKGTVCGGGRYDNLIESIGGKPCAAVGFGMGLERLLLFAEAEGVVIPNDELPTVYIACMGTSDQCMRLTAEMRRMGVRAVTDIMGRGLKAQMKYAAKIAARYTVVVGDNELAAGQVQVRHMADGTEQTVPIAELAAYLADKQQN